MILERDRRRPAHPGKLLNEFYLAPFGRTAESFAADTGIPEAAVRSLLAGRREMTPELAAKIAAALGTSEQFWLNLQQAFDCGAKR